ncbi:transposase [Myxococcus sp. MxC21-1]|uniref:transposase n=1 Tax=Myxococcus sp. MxC21-1 TaxID=3041439 RepID=UPI00292F6126|nr:transposase [Myxococcus sp. MxC21-1]WNZ65834.1 transposase [Myxococcus sp. MxC21-1]
MPALSLSRPVLSRSQPRWRGTLGAHAAHQGQLPTSSRGALALERLSRAEDGRIAYRMKRPLPDGTTHLLFTGLELLRRVASLVPAPRANLTRFHGVFAPGARLRPFLVPQAGAQEASAGMRQRPGRSG